MRTFRSLRPAAGLLSALLIGLACDRQVEPYVPGEEPRTPDLSRIFPEGAERAQRGPGAPADSETTRDSAPPIRGRVAIAPELGDRLPPDAVLFIVARPQAGGPPLAVKRIPSPRFPLEFEIGPNDRMIRSLPFQGPLMLSARLDGDGNATTRSAGDLQGSSPEPVEPGDEDIELMLDQVLEGEGTSPR